MKITIDRDPLLRALGDATSVVQSRNTIPILANVLLRAADGAVDLVATDLDEQLTQRLPATVEAEGAVTLPATALSAIVRELPPGAQMVLALDGERVAIVSGRSRFTLNALPATDFPVLSPPEEPVEFKLPAKALAVALRRVVSFQSVDPARFYLNGMLVQHQDGEMHLVAIDGFRVGHAMLPAPEGAEGMADVILPSRLVAVLGKLITDADGEIAFNVSETRVTIEVGDRSLIGKVIDGQFPDWRRVVPSANPHRLCFDVASLKGALRRVAAIASEKTRIVKLTCERDKLTVALRSPELGEAVEELPVAWEAPDLVVGFNSRFLLEIFEASGAEAMEADLADPRAPMLVTNPADATAQWVIMPVSV